LNGERVSLPDRAIAKFNGLSDREYKEPLWGVGGLFGDKRTGRQDEIKSRLQVAHMSHPNVLIWFANRLKERKKRGKVVGAKSDYEETHAGK